MTKKELEQEINDLNSIVKSKNERIDTYKNQLDNMNRELMHWHQTCRTQQYCMNIMHGRIQEYQSKDPEFKFEYTKDDGCELKLAQ